MLTNTVPADKLPPAIPHSSKNTISLLVFRHFKLMNAIAPLYQDKQKKGLAATRTRGLSQVYLGTLSELSTMLE
jgi:hypothetical protein